MKILGNVIWIVFGGLLISFEYFLAGFLLCCTILGIPFGIQCFKLAVLALVPFGREPQNMPTQSGCVSIFMNILWYNP